MLDNDAINNWDTNGQYSWSDFWNSYSPGGAFQSALDYVLTGNNYAPGSASAFGSHLSNDYWSGAMTNRGIQTINAVGNMAAGGLMMYTGGLIIAGSGGTGTVLGGGYLGVRGGSLLESGLTDYASLWGGNSGNGDYISQWLNNAFGPWGPTIDAAMMALAGCSPCFSGAKSSSMSGMTRVTSWADEGITPDLNSGRWVMLGGPTRLNYLSSGLPFGKGYLSTDSPFIRYGLPKTEFGNYITMEVPTSQIQWPSGSDKWRGVFGQRKLK